MSVNPADGSVLATFEALTPEETVDRVRRAHEAWLAYRGTSFAERAGWLSAAADLLEAEADEISATMTAEMGKTRVSAAAEARKCASGMRFYVEHAEAFLADVPGDTDA
ncbi:MAG: aldehyde dehydrogenase family protein, partial [Micrococcales bacterium]|nr:aldehyde dehydrogenase family protein [Micrococcales bacterium]